MRKGDSVIVAGLSEEQADRVVLLLSSMDIDLDTERGPAGYVSVHVAAADSDRARSVLHEEYPYGLGRPLPQSPELRHDPFADAEVVAPLSWFGRGAAAVVVVFATCMVVFLLISAGPEGISRGRLIDYGAITWARIEAGEHWRLATAIFVHFDVAHLLANMAALLITGPPLAHILGSRRFFVVFLVTGVAANVISHQLAPTMGLKAGASGAIAGIIGALGGHALRPRPRSRYRAWHRLGALAAFYGMLVGFGPGRDNVAHLGGLLVGLMMGRLLPPEPMDATPVSLRVPPDRPRSG